MKNLLYLGSACRMPFFKKTLKKWLFLCAFFTITSNINAQLAIEGEITVDCACPTDNDAFLDITVSGGAPPYTYLWTFNGSDVICSPRVDFSGLDGIGCPGSPPGGQCSPDQSCSTPSDAINAQNFVIEDAILTVSAPIAMGGACIDENVINDSTLDGFYAIRTGVSQLGNSGPDANVTRVWTFSHPVCDLQILLNDIDGEDAIVVNGKLDGEVIPLNVNDFIITNTTPDPACPTFVGSNTWQSQNGCSSSDNTNRGGILVTFPSCIDEIEFIYYDYTGGQNAGGSYAVGFSTICAADLQCIQGGLYQVEVTDANGLVSTAEFDVPDVSIPSDIICPEDIIESIDPSTCTAAVNWTVPVLEDGCPAEILVCTHDSGDAFPIGTTTVTCTATDNIGNVSNCSFDITVNYDSNPTLICPPNLDINADAGSCTATSVTWTAPTLSNDCELTTLTSDFEPGDDFPTGTTTVNYTATDAAGNTFECSFEVIVTNTGLPLILNCPNDMTLTAQAGQCAATATWTPPIPDPTCDATITSSSNNPGDAFPIGTTTVSYIVTDSNGAANTCSFDITVIYDVMPTLVCPVSITLNADEGSCAAASVTWTVPTLSNDCELTTLTSNFSPGDDFPTGTTTVTYTGTDAGGDVFNCSFDITVINTGLPLILDCPDDISVATAPGQCNAITTWTAPTPDPNCDAVISSSSHNPGDIFPIGTTTVTYIITDANGTTNTCSFDVTVNYDSNPTLDCPADIIVNAEIGDCVSSVTWTPPTLSNDCDITTLTSNFNSGDNFPAGTTTVTYTGTDPGGNIFECSFDITVINDAQTAVLQCPDDINLIAAAGECSASTTWAPPVPDANCAATVTGSNFSPGDVFPIGTTTVVYTATDVSGNNFECSFDITVGYESTPTLVCPANISVDADAGSCTATSVTWTTPTLSNDCDLTTLTSNFEPGDDFPTGTTTVTYTGIDTAGDTFECSFDITVTNTGLPLILNCPTEVNVSTEAGACNAIATWTAPTPDPNCDAVISSSSHNPGDTFPIGTTTVTYTITDASGTTNTCSFDVSVNYDSNPTLVCPANISVDADAGSCAATSVTWTAPTLSNDCELTTLTSNFEPGDDFPTGTTTVTYTGADAAGNTFECSFNITVKNTGLPLILNCPTEVNVSTEAGACDAIATWTAPIPDPNCNAAISSISHNPGDTFPIGTTTVTYTITDASGTTNTCSFDVTVNYDSNPTLVCPADISVDADAGSCTATSVTWTAPTLSNDCELTTLTSNFEPGDDFPTGTTTVTYTGADAAGNTFECNFEVTVTNNGLPLILNCPTNINVSAAAGTCNAVATWTAPTPDPNCDAVVSSSSHNPGDIFPIGTTTVTYVITDASGSTDTCIFDVTVTYVSAPTLVCPTDVSLNADEGSCTATSATWTPPTLSNDCELTTLTSDFQPGDVFPTGTTIVTYTGTDIAGNVFECSFEVTLTNTGIPIILNCPTDVNVSTEAGACDAVATWTAPTPDPNCDAVVSSISHNPGDTFPIGTTTVTYIIMDNNGATNTCSFDVIVTYDTDPTLVCPADVSVNADSGSCIATSVTWTPPTLSNDCSLTTLTSDFDPGDDFPTGTTTVTYTGTDVGGNIFECSFDVTVTNTGTPIILNCPTDIALVAGVGQCEAVATWTPPMPDPNCDAVISNSSHDSGDEFPVGTTTVTYVITDGSGNTSICSFDVTVDYNSNPVLVCPFDITVNAISGTCNTTVAWILPSLSNSCNLATLDSDFSPGDEFPVGTTVVTYTATDEAGNTFECSFNVTIVNTGMPIILDCPSDINIDLAPGACDAVVTWTPPTPDPNCDAVITSVSNNPGDTFFPGITTVTYLITDGVGNTNTCSFDVTVNYDTEPSLVCPNDISINAEVGSCLSPVTWTLPTLSNNCNIATLTSNFESGDNFPAGTTTVAYTAIDPGGNTFECSFDVTVINDEQTTVLDCPNDINLSTTAGQCEASATWTPPTPDANCNVTITGSTHQPGDAFPIGTTTVTYTAIDPSENIFECSFDVIVTYNSMPTLICPSDIAVDADAGSCSATSVTWMPPTLSNDCDLTTIESNFAPGDDFPTGITTVTYTASDAAGNIFECNFDITVTNNGPPIIVNCPDNMVVSTNIGECDAIAAWTPPIPDENCDALITSSSHLPGDVFPIGMTTVTYVATGSNGMTTTCSFDIIVTYGQTPTLNCPQSITLNAFPGQCTTSITWTPPALNSNCELVELASNFQPGSAFPVGVTTVTYTAIDIGGNVFECDFNITVNSAGPPLIVNCPNDITVNTSPGDCDAVATWTPPAPDENCTATITSNSHEPGDVFPIGTTTVTYIITDANGLTNTCDFDVTVNYDDNTNLVCPTGITANASLGACTTTATWTVPTLNNGCELTTLTSNYEPGDVFPIGLTTVTYIGSDDAGNVFECSFEVTVIGDSETAVLICPDDIMVSVIPGQCYIPVNWDEPVVDENCGVTLVGGDFSSGDTFPIGTTTVTYTAEDESGNVFECGFDIIVTYSDQPSLICPDDIIVDALPGTCSSPVSWARPIFSSGCGLATLVSNYESGDALPIGTTTVIYTGTDNGENVFECSFDVTVNGNGLGETLICPDDIDLVTALDACNAIVTWEPPVIDENCDANITSSSHQPGDLFPVGITTVTYIATDGSGNETSCSFDINVAYETSPTLVCPEDITVEAAVSACTGIATWDAPILSNDCELDTVLGNYTSGDDFPIGTTTVTISATDNGGNVFECSFDVTVISGNRLAGLVCPDDITTTVTPGQCDATVTWEPPSPDENCGITLTGSNFEPGDVFPIGTTTVTYTAEDDSGNTFDCSFDITVTYIETPNLICPQDIIVDAVEGTCTSPITWAPPVFSSNCGLTTLVGNHEPGDEFPIGTTTVTYVGTDIAGNGFECNFDITVISNGPPVILNCPDNVTVNTSPGQCDGTAAWVAPIVDENCDATMTSSSHQSGDTFPIGATAVTYVATNTAGFQTTCTFDVIVLYDVEPTLVCPGNITADADAGECTTSVTWTPPTLSNDCILTNLESNFSPGDNFPAGTTTVNYTGTDEGGNIFECSFDVTVINDAQTSVLECPFDITIPAGAGQCEAVVIWAPPVPDESCGAIITGSSHQPGDVFQIGTTTIIYTAEDNAGNVFECSFDITIVYSELPTFNCPANITGNADTGACTTEITWTEPTLSNNCNLASLTSNYSPGDDFPTGTTTVTYTGVDTGGNIFECSFDVTVINNGQPLILNCPDDISLVADAGLCEAVATWTPPLPDENCNATITGSSHQPGDAFEIGTTTVSYTVADANGSTNICSFDVTVVYSQIPTLDCPSNITVNAEENSCTSPVTWVLPELNNNCNLVSLTSNYSPGDDFPTGTTTVTHTGIDTGGNVFECSFDVTVINNGPPLILNCPNDINSLTNSGSCEAIVTWTPPIADENCNAIITSSSHNPGDIFPIGTTTVSYIVTDANGGSNTCSFDVTVTYSGSPTLVCPGNISMNTDTEACDAIVTWTEPTLSNDCNLMTINSNFHSGDHFPVGITTVNYTATDNAGTVFECSFEVTVVDNEVPELTCPADISQNVDTGSCTAVVTWTPPSPTDNCADVAVVNSSHEPGDIFNVGTTTVTYTIIDVNGNVANCSFIVAVQDNEAPPIVCPESITLNNEPGVCLTAVTWQEPVRPPSECLADSVVLISNFQSGDLFPVGVTTVEYTAIDDAGNIANCSFNVTIIDVEPPVITCQDDIINIFTNEGSCNGVVTWSLPMVTDNCDAMIVSSSHNSGDTFPIGTTTVTHTAEDAAGNTAECSFDVIVTDKEDPVISCLSDITVPTDIGQCGAIVNWETPVATDNCSATIISNFQSGDFMPVGLTMVTYTATDEAGNTAECSFSITVNDNEPPVITSCPDDITVFADAGECTAVVNWSIPLSVDNCQSASIASTHVSGSIFPIGNTLVFYSILDESGNANVCSFTITVLDDQELVMECPSDITVFTDEGQCNAIVNWTVPVPFDNCGASISNSTHNPGEAFPVGTTTVTYTANDPTGAQVSCSFDIVVIDKQVPTITCPTDITMNNTPGLCLTPVNWATPAVNDNCGVTSIVSTHNPGTLFPVGITTVKYTISDEEGNIAECAFNITVKDNEAPIVLECPSDITVAPDPGACSASVTWNQPTAIDNCSSIIAGSTHTPGALFPIGTTTVLYGILDGDGNGTTCTFTVTVVDNEAPTMSCPADIVAFTNPGQCDAIVEWTEPAPLDNCGANIVNGSHAPGTAFPVGTTTVTYIAADGTGAEIECSFNITVIDKEDPVIVCPENITATNNTGQCGSIVNWSLPPIDDNCGIVDISTSHSSGDFFSIGTTIVTYTATDAEGNTANCSFDITVNDIEAPVIVNCPDDIIISAGAGDCYTLATWEVPTASDNCSNSIIATTHSPGTLFPIGTTTVSYDFLDELGNTSNCSFTITVVDNESPSVVCPSDITLSNTPGQCSAIASWVPPTPIDNCGVEIVSSSHTPGDEFPIGTTTVTYVAATPNGNEVTCSFNITVEDRDAPTIECPDNIILPTIFGVCAAVATWDVPAVSDNCSGEISITSSVPPGVIFLPGTTIVTYTATDLAGNSTNCSFGVTVVDRQLPTVANCPDDIVVTNDPGSCSAVVTWGTPDFSDNCSVADIDSKPSSGSLFEIGTTTVVYEVTDASGNTNSCTFTVTVEDAEDPILACPADIIVSNEEGKCGAAVNWTPPVPVDNCGAEITGNTHNPGHFFPVGTTTVTYTTVNSQGVEQSCSFDVTVEDKEDPVLTCPSDITVPFDNNACDAVVTWNIGLVDNCDATITNSTHNPGDTFEYGTTTVTYTAEDEAGNSHICSFDVTVTDNEAPTIIGACSEDITAAGFPGECSGPVLVPTPQFGVDFSDCIETGTRIINDYNGTANASGIYPVGTTIVTWTVIDLAGNSVTCQQTIIVTPTDLSDDVALVTDKDVFVGAGFDNADFHQSDSIIIVDPGVPDNTIVNTVILDFFFRPEGSSCERDVEIEVTDPAGTVFPVFAAPTGGCTGNDAVFQFILPVASVPAEVSGGGTWKLRFRDTKDQNSVSAGSPNNGSVPAGTEFSVRFGRITYDITVTPECNGSNIVDDSPPAALPVELSYFKGTEEDCEAVLSWETASEINVSHFEIQRSYDGISFSTIDRINALGGEGVSANYTYTDAQLTLTNYYRLEIVDNDGQVEYSDIFTIQADCASGVSISDIFPNPSRNEIINIRFNSNMDHEDAKVIVRDMLGRKMMEVPITVFLGSNLITVDPQRLPAASYFLIIEGAGWRSSSAKFVTLN